MVLQTNKSVDWWWDLNIDMNRKSVKKKDVNSSPIYKSRFAFTASTHFKPCSPFNWSNLMVTKEINGRKNLLFISFSNFVWSYEEMTSNNTLVVFQYLFFCFCDTVKM